MGLQQALHKQAQNEQPHKQALGYPRGNHRPRHFSVRIGWRLHHVTGRRGPAFEVGLGAPPAGRAAEELLRRRGPPAQAQTRPAAVGRARAGGWLAWAEPERRQREPAPWWRKRRQAAGSARRRRRSMTGRSVSGAWRPRNGQGQRQLVELWVWGWGVRPEAFAALGERGWRGFCLKR